MMKCVVFFAAILVPFAGLCADVQASDQRAMLALDAGEDDVVKTLPRSERLILKATLALKKGAPDQALVYLEEDQGSHDPLLALIKAEAHRQSAVLAVASAGDYASGLKKNREQLENADLSPGLAEADVRLSAFMDRLDGVYGQPVHLLRLASDVQSVFMVDKSRSRMFIYERDEAGEFQRVADEYIVTGARGGDKQKRGDARTPNGVYRFVKRLDDTQLEARYGPVAFPIDYPNELDRLHHKNGHGIWMHGYPFGVDRRPPQDTRGCFALPNDRLLEIERHVHLGHSWVVVSENFEFGNPEKRQSLLGSVNQALNQWQADWASLDTEAYLSHYHPSFRSGKRNLADWKRYKRRVNSNKSFIDVSIADVSLIHDPSRWQEGEVVVAEFDQHYRSSNYQDVTRKRIYLARADADSPWQLLIEESVTP
ncbi:MAG: murein L,D-transpeptidase family protein [Mariprofundus sp.]